MSVSSFEKRRPAWLDFFVDREYYRRLFRFAFPIALQQLVMSSLNMVGVVMIGQLGAVPVAGVGQANQIFFLLTLVLFGITSGSAMFTAQLWGKRDVTNIRKVLGLALTLGLGVAVVFTVVVEIFPTQVLGIYSKDVNVIALGSDYLRIIGIIFFFYAISFCYSAVLRSTGDVQKPLLVTIAAFSLNTLLSYALIFGKLGFPTMGAHGAALAVVIARLVECGALLWLVYRRDSPAAARIKELFSYDFKFAVRVMKPVLPVVLNETLWSTGTTAYSVIYGRIGTEAIAAMNIAFSIDQMATVLFSGLSSACAIMVGNRIGAGNDEQAFCYAARSEVLGMAGALVMGLIIILISTPVLSLYNVSPTVIDYAHRVLTIIGFFLLLRVSNMILFVGILRSGGDTRFALILDGVIIWIVGVPLQLQVLLYFICPFSGCTCWRCRKN